MSQEMVIEDEMATTKTIPTEITTPSSATRTSYVASSLDNGTVLHAVQPLSENKERSLGRFMRPVKRIIVSLYSWPKHRCKRPVGDASRRSKPSLPSAFFALPVELQLEVVINLPVEDIFLLRKTSRSFYHLIQDHESHIVKRYFKIWMPKLISNLFPLPTTEPPTLKFLYNVSYRWEVSDVLADVLARRIVKEMGGTSRMKKRPVSPEIIVYVVERLRAKFCPLILAIYHFLETYHSRKQEFTRAGVAGLNSRREKELEMQSHIMKQYPDCLLLQIHQMFHLLLHLLTRRFTEPAWYLSRPIGRWTHTPGGGSRPSEESFAQLLLLGGIPQVLRLYLIKGQRARSKALNKYLGSLHMERDMEGPIRRHGRLLNNRKPIDIDVLGDIWVPAAETHLLVRRLVFNLDNIRCCGEFVAELLGDEFVSGNEGSILDDDDDDIGDAQSAMVRAAMYVDISRLRLADDGFWDQNLMVEGAEDEDEEYVENMGAKEKGGSGYYRPLTPPGKPVAGPSRSPGTIVGMTAPVPGCSGSGYNGMGANFMSMTL